MKSITKEFLESEIVSVEYQRGKGTLTHCYITVKNGFTFTGESACVNEANFNKEIGKKFAYENAFEKMWHPYGFWLKQRTGGTPIERMQIELDELHERMDKLGVFISKPKPDFLDDSEWLLLHLQADVMAKYYNVLNTRLAIAKSKQK